VYYITAKKLIKNKFLKKIERRGYFMSRGKLIFITGGARSGKSSFAEKIAAKTSKEVAYIATGQPLDKEMAL
jgi:adenylylsulfate kinase-like enzyme